MRGRFQGRGRGRAQGGGRNNYQRGGRINFDDQRQYARPRNPAGQISGLLTLHYAEGRSNAHEMERFLESVKNHCMANLFIGLDGIFEIDGDYPEINEPEKPDDEEGSTESDKRFALETWKMEYKHFLDKTDKLESDKAKLTGIILGQMTAESKDRVRQTQDGRTAISEKDPLKLIIQIRATHITHGNRTSGENLYSAQMRYNGIRMFEHGETIQQYMQRFDHELDALKQAAKIAKDESGVPAEKMQALHFIKRLNREYDDFKDAYERHVIKGRASTIREAIEAALRYGKNETK